MTHPDVLTTDASTSLRDFNISLEPLQAAEGEPVFKIQLHVFREGDWELAGLVNLRADEWVRLLSVFQAHEARCGKLPG